MCINIQCLTFNNSQSILLALRSKESNQKVCKIFPEISNDLKMAQYKLTYFDMRGRAEPIRLIFAFADVPFEDIRLSTDEFAKLKPTFPYGQLPVLQFGSTVLSQTNTILRYLGRKFDLHGQTDLEGAKIDELADALNDYSKTYWEFVGSTDEGAKEKSTKKFLEETTPKYMNKFNKILEKNGGHFLVGNRLSWVDILFQNFVEFYEGQTQVKLIEGQPALQQLVKEISLIPRIQQWIEKRPKTDMPW